MKKLLFLLAFTTIFISCESSSGDDEMIDNSIPDQELNVAWSQVVSTGAATDLVFNFNTAYWDENGIYFEDSTDNNTNWVKIEDVIIGGTGQIGLLEAPFARYSRQENSIPVIYSTKVRPSFWIDSPNSSNLILGGSGFTPADYNHGGGSVVQGGYLKVTDHNERYISGECYFTAWVFNSQLNREVLAGAYVEFSGVEYRP